MVSIIHPLEAYVHMKRRTRLLAYVYCRNAYLFVCVFVVFVCSIFPSRELGKPPQGDINPKGRSTRVNVANVCARLPTMCAATVGKHWQLYANILLRCWRVVFKIADKHTVLFFSHSHNYSVYSVVDNADLK